MGRFNSNYLIWWSSISEIEAGLWRFTQPLRVLRPLYRIWICSSVAAGSPTSAPSCVRCRSWADKLFIFNQRIAQLFYNSSWLHTNSQTQHTSSPIGRKLPWNHQNVKAAVVSDRVGNEPSESLKFEALVGASSWFEVPYAQQVLTLWTH